MAIVYTKKNEERSEKTFNAEEYVNRMFNQQKKEVLIEQPKIESTN